MLVFLIMRLKFIMFLSLAVLTRGCKSLIPSTTQVSDGDCASGQFSGNTADICACTGDLCNTATPMKISGAGLIVLCVLTVLLKMIL